MKFGAIKYLFFLCLIIFIQKLIYFSTPVYAATEGLLINEFSSNSSPDWVEIYNFGEQSVDLSTYLIRDSTNTNKVALSGTLQKGGFAAFDFSNRLNNNSDTLRLFNKADGQEILVDSISYGGDGEVCAPLAGGSVGRVTDGGTTIERFKSGTKGATNAGAVLDPCPAPTSILTSTPKLSATHSPSPKPTNTPGLTQQKIISTSTTGVIAESKIIKNTPSGSAGNTQQEISPQEIYQGNIGLSIAPDPSSVREEAVLGDKTSNKFTVFSWSFVLAGIGILVISIVNIIKQLKKDYNFKNEKE